MVPDQGAVGVWRFFGLPVKEALVVRPKIVLSGVIVVVPDQGAVGVWSIFVSGDYSRVVDCMFWRRPEGAGWYDWVLLRSQLEEGADSEEELWVTDESDTDSEESDSGDGEDD